MRRVGLAMEEDAGRWMWCVRLRPPAPGSLSDFAIGPGAIPLSRPPEDDGKRV
jgi:hypothetical protein